MITMWAAINLSQLKKYEWLYQNWIALGPETPNTVWWTFGFDCFKVTERAGLMDSFVSIELWTSKGTRDFIKSE